MPPNSLALSTTHCPQATVLCDLLLLHILPRRHYYKQKKFKYAEDMGPGPVREPTGSSLQRSEARVSVLGSQLLLGADFHPPDAHAGGA